MPFFDWKCSNKKCDFVFEVLCNASTTEQTCPRCETPGAIKQVCAPAGFAGNMPGHDMKWMRNHDKNFKAAKKDYGFD